LDIFAPPLANLNPQFQFTLSTARAENGKPIPVERSSGALVSAATGSELIASGAVYYDEGVIEFNHRSLKRRRKQKQANSLSVWSPDEFARFHNNSQPNWRKCHADIRFARQLRQVFDRIEAIYASHRRSRERDGDISGGFGLRH
jgi:hypothetical protein